jgi:putative membrane protein
MKRKQSGFGLVFILLKTGFFAMSRVAQPRLKSYRDKRNMLMKNALTLIYGIALAVVVSGSAWADSARFNELPSQDRKFVKDAVKAGRNEVQIGQVAAQKAENPAVRDCGTRMTQDNQNANEQLARVLDQKGISEVAPAEKATPMSSHLQNESAADFDRAYLKDTVKEQKNEIAEYKKEAADGKDPELKSFAAESLPALEEQLNAAERTKVNLEK